MSFSRDIFTLLRKLEPAEFQSLMDYASSRCRAAANALAQRLSGMPDADHNGFILAMSKEITSANAILGFGCTLYDDIRIRPPPALRLLTPITVQNRLNDWSAVSYAVRTGRDGGDDLLVHYESSWWFPFQEGVENFRQAPVDIVRAWLEQRRVLPAPLAHPLSTMVNLGCLADDELERAWLIGCDSLMILDKEIVDNQQTIADATVLVLKTQATLRDMRAAMEQALKEEEAKIGTSVQGKANECRA